jgi:hypothetical protein
MRALLDLHTRAPESKQEKKTKRTEQKLPQWSQSPMRDQY